jgi:PST family polysaccharide transporter
MTRPVDTAGVRDAAWSGLEAAAAGGFSLASALVVARLAGPAEFGIAAAAVAVHVLLWVAATALFADALVQRATLDPDDAASAAWASAGVGLLAAGVQAAAGYALAATLGDGRLVAMGWLLAAPLPLVGASAAAQGLLTRGRQYRRLALRTLIGQGAGTAIGLAAAAGGAGAWALVWQQAVISALGALVLLVPLPPALRVRPRLAPVRRMLRLGLPLTAATLLQIGRYRIFAVLVGAAAGPAALGQLHMAFRLVDTVRDLASTALWRLLLPRFAPLQHDTPALQAMLDRALAAYCAVLLPLLGAMLLVMRPLVLWVLGPAWLPAAGAALPLILLAAQTLLGFAGNAALVARGRPAGTLAYQAATAGLTVALCLLWPPADPLAGALLWVVATLLPWPALLWRIADVLDCGTLRPMRAGVPALLATAALTAAAFALPAWLAGAPGPLALMVQRLTVFLVLGLPLAWWRLPHGVRPRWKAAVAG